MNRYDTLQLAWILDNLVEGDLAVDVGANSGQCTLAMAARCGAGGTVIAFEPNPHSRAVLQQNFALNTSLKQANIESFACSDLSCGEVELYQNSSPSNSALVVFSSNESMSGRAERFRVPVTTLDSYFAERGLPAPRFVKIDTEGAEIRILHGAQNILSSSAEILCELHPYAWPQFGNTLEELKQLLAKYNRRMRYLDQTSYIGDVAMYGIVAIERVS